MSLTFLPEHNGLQSAQISTVIASAAQQSSRLLSTIATSVKHQPLTRIAGKGKIIGDIISPATPIEDWNCAKWSCLIIKEG